MRTLENPEVYQSVETGRDKPLIILFNLGLPDGGGDFATVRSFTRALAHETSRPITVQVRRAEDAERLRALITPVEQKQYIRPFDRSIQAGADITITCPLTVDETQFRLGSAKTNYYITEYDPTSMDRFRIPKELAQKKRIMRDGREHILCRAGFHPEALGVHIAPEVASMSMPRTAELSVILEEATQYDVLGKHVRKPFSYQGEPFVLLYNRVNSYEYRDLIRDLFVMCEQKREELLLVISGEEPSFLKNVHYGDERGKRVRILRQERFPTTDFLKLLKAARLALVTGDMSVSEAVALGTPFRYDAPPWKRGFDSIERSYIGRSAALLDSYEEVLRFFSLMAIDSKIITGENIKKLQRAFLEQSQNIPPVPWIQQSITDRSDRLYDLCFDPDARALVEKYHQRLREQHNFARNFIKKFKV